MLLLCIIIGVFFFTKWIIQSVILGLFSNQEFEEKEQSKLPPTIIHNHYTENHLHVDESFLKDRNK